MNGQVERRKYVRPTSRHPQWWHYLHRLWTRSVGQTGYDKRDWEKFEAELYKVTKEKP